MLPMLKQGINCLAGLPPKMSGLAGLPRLVTAMLAAALRQDLWTACPERSANSKPILYLLRRRKPESAGSMHSVPVNLARYLKPETCFGKIALPAKPCDVRAVIERVKRNVLSSENTYVIGLNCGGTMHPEKVRKMLETVYRLDPEEIAGEEIVKGKLVFFTKDGKEHAVPIDDLEAEDLGRRDSCRYCQVKIPTNADLACGNWGIPGELAGKATFVEVMTEKGAELLKKAVKAGFAEFIKAEERGISAREKLTE